MTVDTSDRPTDSLDYELVFNQMPGLCLMLDPGFRIVAQNAAHAKATLSEAKDLIGKNVFEAFPENPDHVAADGLAALRASLLKVLKTREADTMPVIRYDVKPERGPYQLRYWAVTNSPVLGADGYVRWIINRAEDVTELMKLRDAAGRGATATR